MLLNMNKNHLSNFRHKYLAKHLPKEYNKKDSRGGLPAIATRQQSNSLGGLQAGEMEK